MAKDLHKRPWQSAFKLKVILKGNSYKSPKKLNSLAAEPHLKSRCVARGKKLQLNRNPETKNCEPIPETYEGINEEEEYISSRRCRFRYFSYHPSTSHEYIEDSDDIHLGLTTDEF